MDYKLTVLICTWNRCEVIGECFDALCRQTIGIENFEVLVIDNNSTDRTADVVKEYQAKNTLNIRYILETKQGQSIARNRALAEAKTKYGVFLDDDCLARRDSLEKMYLALTELDADIVAGKTINIYPKTMPKILEYAMPMEFPTYRGDRKQMPNGLGTTGNMGLKLDFARKIGFSSELGYVGDKKVGGEDTDFCLRAHAEGCVFVSEPASVCDHLIQAHRINFKDRWITSFCYGVMRTRIKIAERKISKPKRIFMFILGTCGSIIQVLPVIVSFVIPHYALRSFLRFARFCGRTYGYIES